MASVEKTSLDAVDLELLRALQSDSSQSIARLAERVGLSISACHRRVKLLEAAGVIQGYMARLDRVRLGLAMQVFLEVRLAGQSRDMLLAFEAEVRTMDEVLECHLVSGEFDYLLRVTAPGPAEYERLYRDRLCLLPGVAQTRTLLSMSTIKAFAGYDLRPGAPRADAAPR